MIRRAVENDISASPNFVSLVEVEPLANEKERLLAFEKGLSSTRDVLITRISKDGVSIKQQDIMNITHSESTEKVTPAAFLK